MNFKRWTSEEHQQWMREQPEYPETTRRLLNPQARERNCRRQVAAHETLGPVEAAYLLALIDYLRAAHAAAAECETSADGNFVATDWADIADRRVEDVRSGAVDLVAGEEVFHSALECLTDDEVVDIAQRRKHAIDSGEAGTTSLEEMIDEFAPELGRTPPPREEE